ncbi:hypothetical protein BAUCODRAFT_253740 [Baudoinia panamericana UAMH 10762]|uniref:Uncharacterized protein n=1 Tax=Baudoinia panamericana (strain UAMH 10762) TaxID=717646 RepID=M2MMF4_BAUPA|nr:uncharacterized protein BAUCODRAFT_253740 [Baudoinia panamericana UAMH 10762]EMC92558.1 hypothetical protein BAUCODRAFT_253740 [Baudoinia panamericana UAMH 10762]
MPLRSCLLGGNCCSSSEASVEVLGMIDAYVHGRHRALERCKTLRLVVSSVVSQLCHAFDILICLPLDVQLFVRGDIVCLPRNRALLAVVRASAKFADVLALLSVVTRKTASKTD